MIDFFLTLRNENQSAGKIRPQLTFVITVDQNFPAEKYPEGFTFHKNGATFQLPAQQAIEFFQEQYREAKFLENMLAQINQEIEFSNLSPTTKIFLAEILKGENHA